MRQFGSPGLEAMKRMGNLIQRMTQVNPKLLTVEAVLMTLTNRVSSEIKFLEMSEEPTYDTERTI